MTDSDTGGPGPDPEFDYYESLAETVDDAVFVVNEAWELAYANASAVEAADATLEELLGTAITTLTRQMLPEADAHRFERALADTFETERESPETFVLAVETATEQRFVEYNLSPMHRDGEVTQVVGVSRDISNRVEKERELQRRERRLTRLHEATRDLLDAETTQQVAAVASEAASNILDLEINGVHFHEEDADALVPVAASDASRELFGEIPAIDEGIAWEAFQRGELQRYDDIQRAKELYNPDTPIRSEMVLPLGDYGVFIVSSREADGFTDTDVEFARTLVANTEAALGRVTGEQRLRGRQQELERQNDRLEEFASIVSHDLRNPLNVAQGRLELARMDCDSEHLDTVAGAHDRIEALVDDLLTLARGSDSVDDPEDVDLAALVRDCWTTVDTADATYVLDTDRTVRGDRSRLRQLLENLIRNAVEHGGPGVTVTVGDLDDGFYVEDDGPGVPAEKREQVFEEGFSTTAGGTGYGLAIVEQVVEAHGWAVRLTDSDNGGARFEVTGVGRDQ